MENMKFSKKKVFSIFIASLLCYIASACNRTSATKQPEVPCFFIFGDSLVDNGNNNGILTLARANYQPYGVDFAQGATGRFCNGRTVVDVLAQLLGFTDYIPPFSSATGDSLIKGVNFASGASGIRDETGNNLGAHIPMNQQVNNFGRVVRQLRRFFRGDANSLQNYLNKCIIYSGLGSNDYLNNYFMPNYYSTPNQYTPAAYATALLQEYSRQLTDLYRLGARKVIIPGIGPIGCIPYELARFNGTAQSRCNEDKNNVVNLFNSGLRQLVDTINNGQFPGAKFVYLDSFKGSKELTANKKSYGLEVTEEGCCGVGKNNGQITCLPLQTPCENRSKYLFWDAFHPTEVANVIYAKMAYNSKANAYAHPINVRQLATL
ncbi:GDSL esterase/lipase At1g33811-like [Chenopodium quinoa]|uniref:GDSL esterase/lipase At1g33811-like n=1 Tax=Chenopodium quinoa TaxID=63459 RepID=UPI000B7967AB|nr:GDSL esterase/lipase At1g33811-like [Chenopodium quinoa]